MADSPSLRERVGGRWAVSWAFAATVVVLATLAFPYATPISGPPVSVPALMALVGVVDIVSVLLVPLAGLTVFRRRRTHPVPVWAVFALGASIALVREILLRQTLAAFDLRIESDTPLRVLTIMLLGGALAVGFALVLDELERLRRDIDDVNEGLIQLREQERLGDALIASIERVTEAEIAAAANAVLDDIGERIEHDGADRHGAAPGDLRAFVDARLRPLSVELYELQESSVPLVRMRDVLRIGLRSRPVRPGATALLVGPLMLVYQLERFPLGEALVQSVMHAALVYAVLAVVAVAVRHGIIRGFQLPLAAGLAIVATSAKVIYLNVDGPLIGSGILIANGTLIVTAVVSVTLLDALVNSRTATVPTIRATLDEQTIDAIAERRELVRVSRDLATYVHGTLQSTLLSVAFAIEDATRTGDDQRVVDALQDARMALRSVTATDQGVVDDLEQELRRRAEQWLGYLQVSVTVACPFPIPPEAIRTASGIIQEALVNARKHGRATHVRISASMEARDLLVLRVRDDGIGPRGGARGLGSRQLDASAPGAWSLDPNPERPGATLTAMLRLRVPAPTQPAP